MSKLLAFLLQSSDLFMERIGSVAKLNSNILAILDTYMRHTGKETLKELEAEPEYYPPPMYGGGEAAPAEPTYIINTRMSWDAYLSL